MFWSHTQQGQTHVTPCWTVPWRRVHICSCWAAARRPWWGWRTGPRRRSAPSSWRSAGNSWAGGGQSGEVRGGWIYIYQPHKSAPRVLSSPLNMKPVTHSWPSSGGVCAHTCQSVFSLANEKKINDSLAAVLAQQQVEENCWLLPNSTGMNNNPKKNKIQIPQTHKCISKQ